MTTKTLVRTVFTALTVMAASAQASPMLKLSADGGTVLGITGINVGGDFYDATFNEGSFNSLYASDSATYLLTPRDSANDANQALKSTLDALIGGTDFTKRFNGCADPSCTLRTAYEYVDDPRVNGPSDDDATYNFFTIAQAGYPPFIFAESPGLSDLTGANFDLDDLSYVSWARSASVPEPGTLALVGLCLAGLGALRRKARPA